jgi:PAS domain S-box-containing protein
MQAMQTTLVSIGQRRGAGYLTAVLGIAAVIAVCAPFHDQLNHTTVALALLLVVLGMATLWGRGPGIVASVLGMLCFNFFFLPPLYTLTIADPQNWITLAAFFTTASTVGHLSVTAKRRAAEAEAGRQAARLASLYNRSLLEASLDPLVTIGPDGKITDVNAATEMATGRTRAELIGTDFSDYFTEPDKAQAGYQQVFRDGFVRDYALELRHRDGHLTSVLYNASVYRDDSGTVRGVFAAARDITERKLAEEALQRSAHEIRQAADEISDLYNHAPCGYHSLDTHGIFVRINDTELAWLGYTREEVIGKMHVADLLTPAGVRLFQEYFPKFKETGVLRDLECDLVRKDGTCLPVLISATAMTDRDGNYLMSRATVYDITARKRAEDAIRRLARLQAEVAEMGERALRGARLSEVLDAAVTQVVQALNADYCQVLELLPSRQALLLRHGVGWKPGYVGQATVGLGRESQAGYTLLADAPVVVEDLRTEPRFADTALLHEHDVVSGISVVISMQGGPYGVLGVHTRQPRAFTRDEINFLQAVANVLGSAIERYQDETQLRRLNRTNRALSRCNEALIRATDESTLLQQICDLVIEEAGYRLCWVGFAEHNAAKSVRPVAQAGFEAGYLDTLYLTWADTERGRGPTGTCIRTCQPVLAKHIATDPTMRPWRAEALKRGYASSVAIPLSADAVAFGAINIYAPEPEAFGPEEVKLLTELADDLAFGITTLRTRLERARVEVALRETEKREEARKREIEIGFKIQQMLLFNAPPRDVPGLRVAALTIPSQRIDGDFYDFFTHENQCLDVIVADVMGKGIPAALLGAATKSQFREALSHLLALSRPGTLPEPKDIVLLAHAEMGQQLITLENFVTLCYARVDPNERRLTLVDCGHTGVMHFRARSSLCTVVHGNNLPLGIRAGEIYEQISVAFEPGDVLLFYSDGVTEARNPAGELFGAERLADCVRSNGARAPEALVEAIRQAVCTFAASDQLTDDLTCVALKVQDRPLPLARAELELRSDLAELRRARAFVRAVCSALPGTPLAAERVAELELAVNEATSNIMKHAYQGRTDQHLYLEAETFPDRVVIRLYHSGDPCDPTSVPPPALDGSQESGFGLYLITRSVDAVRYYRDARGRNCIALVKSRRA